MWKRIKIMAKKDVSAYMREVKKTGGGSVRMQVTETTERIKAICPSDFKEPINPYDCDR